MPTRIVTRTIRCAWFDGCTIAAMDDKTLRLECLRLASVAARTPSEVLARAKMFEAYVLEVKNEVSPKGRRAKKDDKLDVLLD